MSPRGSNDGDHDDADEVDDTDPAVGDDEASDVADDAEDSDVEDSNVDDSNVGDSNVDDTDDADDAEDDEVGESDRVVTPGTRSASGGSRQANAALSDRQTADAIRQVDSLERRIGFAGAALTIVIGLVAFAPYISNPKKRVSDSFPRVGKHCPSDLEDLKVTLVKGVHQCTGTIAFPRSHWITEFAIVMLFAAFIGVATWYGRRSLVAFSLLFGGLAIVSTTGSIVGIAYVGAGGWLMVRAYRVQKYGTTSGKEVASIVAEQRAERKATGKSGGTTRSSARSSTGGRKEKNQSKKDPPSDGKSRPQANKRYTPKTPQRKRPVPPSS